MTVESLLGDSDCQTTGTGKKLNFILVFLYLLSFFGCFFVIISRQSKQKRQVAPSLFLFILYFIWSFVLIFFLLSKPLSWFVPEIAVWPSNYSYDSELNRNYSGTPNSFSDLINSVWAGKVCACVHVRRVLIWSECMYMNLGSLVYF